MCGRRKLEREWPEPLDWGDMDFSLLEEIAWQVPEGIIVQFHWNGEPTLYPKLGKALELFDNNTRCFDTNGKLLLERFDEIKGNMEALTISVIEKDPEAESQFEIVSKFIEKKGYEKPLMVYRLLGKVENAERWEALPGIVARRILHAPEGSFDYQKDVTIPETGICIELLSHLAVDRYGNASPCVRFDPHGRGRLASLSYIYLENIWNGNKRKQMINDHIMHRRDKWPLCASCDYWGIPKG